jgi:hypothetical protein
MRGASGAMPVVMRGLEEAESGERGVLAQRPRRSKQRCRGGMRAVMETVRGPMCFIAAMARISAALVVGFTRIPSSIEVRQF